MHGCLETLIPTHALTLLALQDLYQWNGAASILPVLHLIETASQVHPPLNPKCQQRCKRHPACKVKAYAFEVANQLNSILSLHCKVHTPNSREVSVGCQCLCPHRNVCLSHALIACCAGTIPADYGTSGSLPKLTTLQLSGNLLNGTIPERSAARKHLARFAVANAVDNIMCMGLLLFRQPRRRWHVA